MTAALCAEDGCEFAALHLGRCAIHGDATADTCSDCGAAVFCEGRCRRHYERLYRARKRALREAAAR